MKYSISDIPQADELKKVILTVEAVDREFISDQKIADYVGFTDRQGRYYRLAAELLGLMENEGNRASLTELGKSIIVLDAEHRMIEVNKVIKEQPFFKDIIEFIEKGEDGVSRGEIVEFMKGVIEGAESTIMRRVTTVLNWLKEAEIIIVDYRELENGDKENIFIINNLLESDLEDESKGSIYPVNYENDELDIRESHMAVISLIKRYQQGKITIPEFQRNQVWSNQQKSRFIESLILNVPIPPFYVSQDSDGKYIIVDGLQRTTAIVEYLDNIFPLVGLEALPNLNGIRFEGIEEKFKARIEDRDLLLYILKPSVPMEVVYDIFNRINSNGTPLTRQEIRNCIFIGEATRLLHKLSEKQEFKKAIDWGISPRRMKDQESILRFLAFILFDYEQDYTGDMDGFLGRTMRKINRMTVPEREWLEKYFTRVMETTFDFFGNQNFRLPTQHSRGRINIALMEVVCYFFHIKDDEYLNQNKTHIKISFENLLIDQEFIESIRYSTGSPSHVKTRFNKVLSI